MRFDRFGGIDVRRLHEPARPVRADRQQREADGLESPRDLREVIAPARIAGEVHVARFRADHESAPQIAIAIGETARREMLRRNRGDDAARLPPVELGRIDAVSPHQGAVAERREDRRACQASERRDVEMIVVIVADEHEIDRRKIFEADAGRPVSLRTDRADRRRALGPDRIGEDVHAVDLNQRRRMIDEGDSQLAVSDAGRRRRTEGRVAPLAPRAALASEHPFQKRALALPAGVRVVKSLAVEVIALRTAITRRGDERPFDRRRRSRGSSADRDSFCGASHADIVRQGKPMTSSSTGISRRRGSDGW